MSLFELLVVIIVGVLVSKPEDLPKMIAKFKEIRAFVINTKKEIMSHIDPIGELESSVAEDVNTDFGAEMEQMNFYLEKISSLGSEYEGEYSMMDIKNHYRRLVNEQIKQAIKAED